jgi:hypothetical protein
MVSRLQRKCVTNGSNKRRRGVRSLTEQFLQARPGTKDRRHQGFQRLLTQSLWLRVQMLDMCHTCESNRIIYQLNSGPQIMYPSRTGTRETTCCQTELDPYQPAKGLAQTLDSRKCAAFERHRSLTHVAAGLSRRESVNKTARIKRHVEVEHRDLKFS